MSIAEVCTQSINAGASVNTLMEDTLEMFLPLMYQF